MQTIRSCGKINIIDEIPREKGMLVAKDFLESLAKGIVKYSSKYMRLSEESPFSYHERQLSSVIAPALAEVAEAFLMEVPARRRDKKLKLESRGWIDYWAFFRNIDFYIELKHSYASYRAGAVTEETSRRWKKANQQATDCGDGLMAMGTSKGILSLPFHVIPIYESAQVGEEASAVHDLDSLLGIQMGTHSGLKPKPNWSCLWVLHEGLARISHAKSDSSDLFYPAILLVAKVPHLTEVSW